MEEGGGSRFVKDPFLLYEFVLLYVFVFYWAFQTNCGCQYTYLLCVGVGKNVEGTFCMCAQPFTP